MNEQRHYAAAIQLHNGSWWITGGMNTALRALDSTEVLNFDKLTENAHFTYGTSFPKGQGVLGHCITRVNEDLIFLGGGNTKNAYLFNETSSKFITLPSLLYKRSWPACSVVNYNNEAVVMVVGGYNSADDSLNVPYTTEIIDINNWSGWQLGTYKVMHDGWSNGDYVTYTHEMDSSLTGFILVGGKRGSYHDSAKYEFIYRYDEENHMFYELSKPLEYPREDPTVVVIPEGDINCGESKMTDLLL